MTYDMAKDRTKDRDAKAVSIYFDGDVLRALDRYAEAQKRSRSWLANEIIREKCGVIPEQDGDED